MYFDDLLLNVLVIIVYITLMTLLNMYLNKHARLLMNYSSKLNLTNEEFIKKYNLDNKVNISVSPSSGGNDLDGYFNIGDFDPSTTEYIIECTDIDGEMNGSYESVTKEIAYDESLDIVIKMTPKRQ